MHRYDDYMNGVLFAQLNTVKHTALIYILTLFNEKQYPHQIHKYRFTVNHTRSRNYMTMQATSYQTGTFKYAINNPFPFLFVQQGAWNFTLLGKAAAAGYADIVELLLAAGAAVTGKDKVN